MGKAIDSVRAMFRWFKDLLYPNLCMFCGTLLTRTDSILCCESCEKTLTEIGYSHTAAGDLSVAWAVYDDAVRDAIHKFKFRRRPQLAHTFAYLMRKALVNLDGYDTITWVPTSVLRKQKRGYDQSELLAKALSDLLDIPAVKLLRKIGHNRKQSGLDAARRAKNVCGRYRADAKLAVGRNVLVIDDVYTTGATMSECMKTLKTAGAASCMGLTIARTQKGRKKNRKK